MNANELGEYLAATAAACLETEERMRRLRTLCRDGQRMLALRQSPEVVVAVIREHVPGFLADGPVEVQGNGTH